MPEHERRPQQEDERPRRRGRREQAPAQAEHQPAVDQARPREQREQAEQARREAREEATPRAANPNADIMERLQSLPKPVRAKKSRVVKAVGSVPPWLERELSVPWTEVLGIMARKFTNTMTNIVFNPFIRIGAMIESWGLKNPFTSWIKKSPDTADDLADILPKTVEVKAGKK
ncbi:hypothetical protein HYV72_01985 [Candidatus Uhrbacteria bacterium]|nr:hypothetical protein [Candidatus Uhrbacteria bacterium]